MNAHRLVEITPATHRVDIDLVYATDRNLTGKPIYRHAHCLLLAPAEAALRRAVLVDGEIGSDGVPRLFFQTFVKRRPGEIFFEIVQRKGHHGFGEGNLAALARARDAG